MNATKKMDAFGMKALEAATGRNLVTLYRWRRALLDGGSISDRNKRALIDATRQADQPLSLADFYPQELSGAPANGAQTSEPVQ
jgi:hypothetical protein